MKYFFCEKTGGNYMDEIHASIPKDAVEITKDLYQAVFASPAPGKVVGIDKKGLPCLIDPPAASYEEVAATERVWRDGELNEVRWIRERHRDEQDMAMNTTLTADQFSELLGYIQNLRDWPESKAFPDQSKRPARPEWIASQML